MGKICQRSHQCSSHGSRPGSREQAGARRERLTFRSPLLSDQCLLVRPHPLKALQTLKQQKNMGENKPLKHALVGKIFALKHNLHISPFFLNIQGLESQRMGKEAGRKGFLKHKMAVG